MHAGCLRFLDSASSRATKIYGDLAKIYGASPQFFATVSGLNLQCTDRQVSAGIE